MINGDSADLRVTSSKIPGDCLEFIDTPLLLLRLQRPDGIVQAMFNSYPPWGDGILCFR